MGVGVPFPSAVCVYIQPLCIASLLHVLIWGKPVSLILGSLEYIKKKKKRRKGKVKIHFRWRELVRFPQTSPPLSGKQEAHTICPSWALISGQL